MKILKSYSRFLAILLAIFFVSNVYATIENKLIVDKISPTKPALLKRKKIKFLNEFYQWFNVVGENKTSIDFKQLKQFFTHDAEFYHNGTKMASSHKGIYAHLLLGQKYFQLIKAEMPFEDIIVSGDKVVVRFVLDFKKVKKPLERHQVISIFQLKNGKIYRWWEVEKKIRKFG